MLCFFFVAFFSHLARRLSCQTNLYRNLFGRILHGFFGVSDAVFLSVPPPLFFLFLFKIVSVRFRWCSVAVKKNFSSVLFFAVWNSCFVSFRAGFIYPRSKAVWNDVATCAMSGQHGGPLKYKRLPSLSLSLYLLLQSYCFLHSLLHFLSLIHHVFVLKMDRE